MSLIARWFLHRSPVFLYSFSVASKRDMKESTYVYAEKIMCPLQCVDINPVVDRLSIYQLICSYNIWKIVLTFESANICPKPCIINLHQLIYVNFACAFTYATLYLTDCEGNLELIIIYCLLLLTRFKTEWYSSSYSKTNLIIFCFKGFNIEILAILFVQESVNALVNHLPSQNYSLFLQGTAFFFQE